MGPADIRHLELATVLRAHGEVLLQGRQLTPELRARAHAYFSESLYPALIPLAVDSSHPFPRFAAGSLSLGLLVKRARVPSRLLLAVVGLPPALERLVPILSGSQRGYLPLEDLVSLFAADLFPGFTIEHAGTFRVSAIREAPGLELHEDASPELEEALGSTLGTGGGPVRRVHSFLPPALRDWPRAPLARPSRPRVGVAA